LLTRAEKPWHKKIGSKFRDARGRAGELTAFILTLKGVYQVPLKTVGGALAAVTAFVPSIFFFKNLKKSENNVAAPSQQSDPGSQQQPSLSSTAQIMQQQLQHTPSNMESFVKYLDCSIGFMGQFGTNHMEMMIASAALNFEFVDYDWLMNPKNFAMLAYMLQAFYHSTQVFLERKASYENVATVSRVSDHRSPEARIAIPQTGLQPTDSAPEQTMSEARIDIAQPQIATAIDAPKTADPIKHDDTNFVTIHYAM